nr:transposase [Vibrio neptunius]
MLTKVTVETALNAELDEHLGYQKHQSRTSSNSRNDYSGNSIITEDGKVDVDVLRAVKLALSLNSYASTKLDSNPWTTRYLACTRKA